MEMQAMEEIMNLKPLMDMGLAGAVIILFCLAIVRLYNRNQALGDSLMDLTKQMIKTNEAMTKSLDNLHTVITALIQPHSQIAPKEPDKG